MAMAGTHDACSGSWHSWMAIPWAWAAFTTAALRRAAAWSAMTKRAGQVGCGSRKAPASVQAVSRVEQRAVRAREEDAYMSVHMAGQVDRYHRTVPKDRGLARPRAGRRPPHIPGFGRQNRRDPAGEGERPPGSGITPVRRTSPMPQGLGGSVDGRVGKTSQAANMVGVEMGDDDVAYILRPCASAGQLHGRIAARIEDRAQHSR